MPETIKAKELQLEKIFANEYRFDIPDYQRPYAWTTEQTAELLDDLLYAMGQGEDSTEASPYFLGSIVIIQNASSKPVANVVDGQQRITTLTILLCVLRELAAEDEKGDIHQFIRETSNRFARVKGQFRLNVRERDKKFFQDNIQEIGRLPNLIASPPAGLSDGKQRMFENTDYLWKSLSNLDVRRRDALMEFLILNCYLVVVSASDQNSAYRIFSVMNDRGLDLSPTDILKAEIIGAMDKKIRSEYADVWVDIEEEIGRDNFRDLFAHIRMIYTKEKARRALNQEFHDNVLNHVNGEKFVDDVLTPFANAYETVSRADYESANGAERVNLYLEHLRWLDNFDWIPPAMAFFNLYKNDTDSLVRFVRDLERLAYGMFIRRANINERINRYARVLHAIEKGKELFEGAAPLQLNPEEKAEILRALEGPVYTIPRVPRPLLLRLDSLLADTGATYEHKIITVEHVLPQHPKDKSEWINSFPDQEVRDQWTHKLANLVLLSRYKNSQAQNFDFDRKKEKYFQRGGVATFALTSQVLNEKEWTLEVLHRRQKRLIHSLRKEWRLD